MANIGDGLGSEAIEQNADIARLQAQALGAQLVAQQVSLPDTGFVSSINAQEGALTIQPGTSTTGVTVNVTNGAGTISIGVVIPAILLLVKNNFAAVLAPTVAADAAAGYSVGSSWVDTLLDDAYICVDSTNGAAVWKKTTP